jgi:hypothetical protein
MKRTNRVRRDTHLAKEFDETGGSFNPASEFTL